MRLLVEGESDRVAVETLAQRLAVELPHVEIVVLGGIHAVGRALDGRPTAGLCDAGEEHVVRGALARAGRNVASGRAGLEVQGFFVCERDLEEELIRALGVARVEGVLQAQGHLRAFRTMQRQPAQRGRPADVQLRRWIASHSGHKRTYARLLVEALPPGDVPSPLAALLAHLQAGPVA